MNIKQIKNLLNEKIYFKKQKQYQFLFEYQNFIQIVVVLIKLMNILLTFLKKQILYLDFFF